MSEARDREPTESYRPALVKLTADLGEMQEEVLSGFPSRRDVLMWMQRLTVRTLGELPQRFYWELARQFRLDIEATPVHDREEINQPVLLAALLEPIARDRDLPEEVVDELRERLLSTMIRPAHHRAFRELRKGAGEYIEESDEDSSHNPAKQRFIAMRPALDELDQRQEEALVDLLEGFDSSEEILSWGETVELATHGEVNEVDKPDWVPSPDREVDFITRCHTEPQTRGLLTSSNPELQEARQLFAAVHLVPAYNRGVRDMAGRAGELPDAEREQQSPTQL